MRALVGLLIALLIAAPVAAQDITATPPSAGALPAQTSTGSANPGGLGEFVSAQANGESIAVTITNATPAVVTMTANTFAARCIVATGSANACYLPINFTGLAGTHGIANSTLYYVCPATISGSNFSIATSIANCLTATYVATSGTDSGTGVASLYQTSGSPQAVAAINLTAGDWDCSGSTSNAGVTSTLPTAFQTTIASSIATNGSTAGDGSAAALNVAFTGGTSQNAFTNTPHRFSFSTITPVYLVTKETWSGGVTSPTTNGLLRCRRAG